MREMFYNCTNLEVVDMSSIVEVENLKDYKNMFKTCSKLKTLSISNEFLDHCVKQSGKTIDSVLETMAIKDTGTAQLKTNLVNQYNEYLKTPITDCTITAPDKDYDGNPPSITVTSGDTVLEENTDYTVTFKQGDTVIDPPVDPGTYECTITGKGNYRGSTTLEFTISPKNTGASLLKKNTVSFKDSISLNFLAEIDDDKADGAYVKFTYDHYGQTKVKNVSLRRDDKNGKYFRFRCPLTASEMTVDVTAELFLASSGSPVDTWTRNIRDYCLTGLDQSSNDLEKTLFRAALNYGGYTQEYFKHNKGTIANTGITDDMTDVTVSSGITSAYPTGVHNGIRYIGSSLLLRDAPYVRYYFEPDTGSDIGDYTFTLRQNGSDTTPNVAHNKDGYYIESVSELAYQLDNAQTVTVTKGEDEVFSFDYSVIKWAESASADTDADDEELNMARALYRYYIAAKAFVDSNKT
ncbi:MAG: hypothetical protein J5501_11350 [Ruminococcus sp.]|nr:hypothetical protein [Ruminococcus sp.]